MNVITPLPPRVIINEFRSRGPNGPTDQFVELYNDSLTPSTLGATLTILGATSVNLAIPVVTIGSRCHLLITAPGYSGTVPGDVAMTAILGDTGALTYQPAALTAVQRDAVAMNATTATGEGTTLAPFGTDNSDRSYVRVGRDTNNNASDFVMRAGSTPQNSTMCGSQ